nr:uncharacterized protein LOC127327011 isoform X2 [Lolium perenne]
MSSYCMCIALYHVLIVLFLSGIWFFSIGTEREPEINAPEEQHQNNEGQGTEREPEINAPEEQHQNNEGQEEVLPTDGGFYLDVDE